MWIRTVSGWRFFEVEFTSQGIPFVKTKKEECNCLKFKKKQNGDRTNLRSNY